MNRPGLRLFAVSVSLIFWVAPAVTAQTSTAPPSPATPAVTPSVAVERIVTDALSTAKPSVGNTPAGNAIYLNSRVFNGLSEKRQDIDLVDVPLKEALKRVLDESKTTYVIDDDVPNEPKVSIKLANAPLTTILDALTLSNKIGWRTEFKRGKAAEETTNEVKIDGTYVATMKGSKFETQIHVGKTVAALPSAFQFRTMDIEAPPPSIPPGFSGTLTRAAAPQPPQLRIYRWQSQKRTFTCPRCHNSVSIIQQPEEVKCTKCHREFEDNWQVCPFDGTKRPERKDMWRFCPICGKSIKMEAAWSEPTHIIDYYRLDLPSAFEIHQGPSAAGTAMPGLWNSEGEAYIDPIPSEKALELLAPFAAAAPDLLPLY